MQVSDLHTRPSDSPEDEHWVVRNMYRSEINTLKKCIELGINMNCWEYENAKGKNRTWDPRSCRILRSVGR